MAGWRLAGALGVGITVALALAGVLLGVGSRMGNLPSPGIATVVAGVLGAGLASVLARSGLALRLFPAGALLVLAGTAATPLGAGGVGVGLAFLAGPLLVWGSRFAGADGATVLLLPSGVLSILALTGRVPIGLGLPIVLVGWLALAGVVVAATPLPPMASARTRFDLRAALAIAGIVVVGFVAALFASRGTGMTTLPAEYGGAGVRLSWAGFSTGMVLGLLLLNAILMGFLTGPAAGAWRLLLGLGVFALGALAALAGGFGVAGLFLLAIPYGIATLLPPALKRIGRVREGAGPAALVLAGLFGMPLAAGIVRAFARALPGPIGANGGEVAARMNPTPVFLFYGALALVVLLAHLAFVYEFGLAALAPAEGTDRLPILRRGFQKRSKTG